MLSPVDGVPGSDYINANYIDVSIVIVNVGGTKLIHVWSVNRGII